MIRAMVLGLSMLLLAACSGTGPGSGTDQGTVPTTLDSFGFNPLPLPENVAGGFSWTVNGTRLTCRVDVDNNGINEYTVENCTSSSRVAHTYGSQGTYVAKLTVSGEDGQSKSKLLTINVGPANILPVIAVLDATTGTTNDPLQVSFNWVVNDGNSDITQCIFDANSDGQIEYEGLCSGLVSLSQVSRSSTVTYRLLHKYPKTGTYKATLEAADPYGKVVASVPVRLSRPPVIEVLAAEKWWRKFKVNFRVSHPDGDTVTCRLDLGKLGKFTFEKCSEAERMIAAYSSGKYPVRLEATDTQGNTVSRSIEVELSTRQIKAGTNHSCALTSAGYAFCAGWNGDGQLGLGNNDQKTVLTRLPGVQFASISPGGEHNCALDAEGVAYCWGKNEHGRLGLGDTSGRNRPQPVLGGHTFVQLLAEDRNTCGLTDEGAVYCWGNNHEGQLGNDNVGTHSSVPQRVVGNQMYTHIGVGESHVCALSQNGDAYCWGKNFEGQLGIGQNGGSQRPTPQKVVGGLKFADIWAGDYHNCALTAAGKAYCWGWNDYGSLGIGSNFGSGVPSPQPVEGGHTFTQLALGDYQSCGLTPEGKLYCWGRNEEGQLGIGAFDRHRSTPQLVTGFTFQQVDAGDNVVCAMTVDYKAYCWGKNNDGQLGIGNTTYQSRPQFVMNLP